MSDRSRSALPVFGPALLLGVCLAVLVPLAAAGDTPAAQEVDQLIEQLGSEKFAERQAASKRLAEIGERALSALHKALDSPDLEIRHRAEDLVRVLERRLFGELRVLAGHTRPIVSVALAPDGKLALTGGNDQTLRLWDVETGR